MLTMEGNQPPNRTAPTRGESVRLRTLAPQIGRGQRSQRKHKHNRASRLLDLFRFWWESLARMRSVIAVVSEVEREIRGVAAGDQERLLRVQVEELANPRCVAAVPRRPGLASASASDALQSWQRGRTERLRASAARIGAVNSFCVWWRTDYTM